MARSGPRRALPPLDESKLNELALQYVGRFATTRSKLRNYLARKVRERGWNGALAPDLSALADHFAKQGYIDDCAYALSKSRALAGRGYGKRRVLEALRAAGIEEGDSVQAEDLADQEAIAAALRFARKRRLGPFAECETSDPKKRQKAIAMMVRAGHGFGLARAIVLLIPGAAVDIDDLAERARASNA